jgi:hypothetical protein
MQITTQQAQKLLTREFQFTVLSFGMMVTRLKNSYLTDQSVGSLQKCTDDLNAYFNRYSDVIEADSSIIKSL